MPTTQQKLEELNYAKKAVLSCLENSNTSVDFHGIAYWAKRVEDLRKEILETI